MRKLTAFAAGLIFGMGLLLAGMADPAKVLGFLDLFGRWDPSLGLVMAGAIAVAIVPMQWARRQQRSLLGALMQLPLRRRPDRRLIGGSLLFGIGWGIAGICPAPALSLLLAGYWQAFFVRAGDAGRHGTVQRAGKQARPLIEEIGMKANIGTLDRSLRIAAGLFLIVLSLFGVIGWWGWLGVVPLATGLFRFCPAYRLLGISSCKCS